MDGDDSARRNLPLVLRRIAELCRARRAHASPTSSMPATATCIRSILYNANDPAEGLRAEAAGADIS